MKTVLILLLLIPLFSFSHLDLFDSKNGSFLINKEISKNHNINFSSSRDIIINEIILNNINIINPILIKIKLNENSLEVYSNEHTFIKGDNIKFNTSFNLKTKNKYSFIIEFETYVNGDLFLPYKYPYSDITNTIISENKISNPEFQKGIPLISFDADLNDHIDISTDNILKDFEDTPPFKEKSIILYLPNDNFFLKLDSLGLSYYESGKDNLGNLKISVIDLSSNKTLLTSDSSIFNLHKSQVKLPINLVLIPKTKYLITTNIDSSYEKDGMVLSFKPIRDTLYFIDSSLIVLKPVQRSFQDSLFPFLIIDGELEKIQNLNLHKKIQLNNSINSPFHPIISKNFIYFKLNSNFDASEKIENVSIKIIGENDIIYEVPHTSKEFNYKIKKLKSNSYTIKMITNKQVLTKNFIISR
jgi:hypothetical protein